MKKRMLLFFAVTMAMSAIYAQTTPAVQPPPPPPPPLPSQEREVFKVVETKPAFPGCQISRGSIEHSKCSETKMLEFIYGHLEYPEIALKNGVEGTVYIKFIIEKDSSLTSFEIIRDIGAGCGEAALKAAMQMPKWEPGLQRGRPVAVQFNLPVKFSLDYEEKRKQDKKKAEGTGSTAAPLREKPNDSVNGTDEIPSWVISPATQDAGEIFKVVEEQPMYSGCEHVTDKSERQKCAQTKMLEFIYANIKYPAEAKKNKVQGTVYVQFVIEKDGSITNHAIIRDIGSGCGEESLRAVKLMPKWNPGKQRGRPVRVQFNLPIKFSLE